MEQNNGNQRVEELVDEYLKNVTGKDGIVDSSDFCMDMCWEICATHIDLGRKLLDNLKPCVENCRKPGGAFDRFIQSKKKGTPGNGKEQ